MAKICIRCGDGYVLDTLHGLCINISKSIDLSKKSLTGSSNSASSIKSIKDNHNNATQNNNTASLTKV